MPGASETAVPLMDSVGNLTVGWILFAQEIRKRLLHDLPTHFSYRRGQRYFLRANLDAVLGVPAFLNAAVPHERRQTLVFQRRAGGMRIKQTHLRDSRCADETCVFVELRTGLHATAARDAVRQRIRVFLVLLGSRAGQDRDRRCHRPAPRL